MKVQSNRVKALLKSALGAALVSIAGLLLYFLPFGAPLVNLSYDYIFRFASPAVTNNVILIQLDNEAYDFFHQTRGEIWDRGLHAGLLNRLADDGCALVVMDTFFANPRDPATDEALAAAMRRQRGIILMAKQARVTHPDLRGARPILPAETFLSAARTNWGVAWLDPDLDFIVRRHWPFPDLGPYESLPMTAAKQAGASLDDIHPERWLRYYGRRSVWTEISYRFALTQPQGFYRDRIVFIGSHPATSVPGDEADEFSNPYTRWTGESTGGVEILITEFLNYLRGDWLRRPAATVEVLGLTILGVLLGAGFCCVRLGRAFAVGAVATLLIVVAGISLTHTTSYWFPWLIAALQAPIALGWAFLTRIREAAELTKTVVMSPPGATPVVAEPPPEIPGLELAPTPFGEGAYGKVWLAKDRAGVWHALKVVYLAKFEKHTQPYEREFNGVNLYRRISDQHPGLLRVSQVSEKLEGYFYYVMELGDAVDPGWKDDLALYRPRDLVNVRTHLPGKRLPTRDCIRIGLILCEALDFLHRQGLTHRDIKPQNIIFVNGKPKLADVGLISEIRPPDEDRTVVGTPGYMPPAPEKPGTPQADIYSLGMVLYVLSTGSSAALFPEISSTLVESRTPMEFMAMNTVILRACQPDLTKRFSSVAELAEALREAEWKLNAARAELPPR